MGNISKAIGAELRRLRKQKGLSLEEAAERLGYKSKNTVSRIELGETQITVEDLARYAVVLDTDYITILYSMKNPR